MNHQNVFFSHASDDREIVARLESLIERVFQSHFIVFNSSNLRSLPAGEPWRAKIKTTLQKSRHVLVIITPNSLNNNWVMYEAGACWFTPGPDNQRLTPCLYGVSKNDIPSVLSENHAVNLLEADGVYRLLETMQETVPFKPSAVLSDAAQEYVEYEKQHKIIFAPNSHERSSLQPLMMALAHLVGKRLTSVATEIIQRLFDESAITPDERVSLIEFVAIRKNFK